MLIKLAAIGALGYAGYRYYEKNRAGRNTRELGGPNSTSQFEPTVSSRAQAPKVDTWDSPEANDPSPTRTTDTPAV